MFARRTGASQERREQLAWLGYVGLLTAVWAAILIIGSQLAPDGPVWLGRLIWTLMTLTPVAGIPLACVVAVTKYRLYEIDRLISRTVSYAIVTGLLIGVYARLILLATHPLPLRGPVAVAGSTLTWTRCAPTWPRRSTGRSSRPTSGCGPAPGRGDHRVAVTIRPGQQRAAAGGTPAQRCCKLRPGRPGRSPRVTLWAQRIRTTTPAKSSG